MLVEEAREVTSHAFGVGERPIAPGGRVQHRQAHDLDARRHEGELAFVVGVGRIEQHHGIARIEQRAEEIVGQLRAAEADGDVLGADPRHGEQVLLEARDRKSTRLNFSH